MKKSIFIFILSASVISYCSEQYEIKKIVLPQRFPTTIISRTNPDRKDATASKYDWYQHALSKEWIGFLQVKYWDVALASSKLSRRSSIGQYPEST